MITFTEYQLKARKTAIYPIQYNVVYPALGLAGKTGEVCEKIKKVLRDNHGKYTKEKLEEIARELGDVLWYISNICSDLNLSLEEVAKGNLIKLETRLINDKIHSNGDNR